MEDLGLIPDQQPLTLGQQLGRYMALANKKIVPMGTAMGAGALAGAPFAGVGAGPGALAGLASYGVAHLSNLPVAAYNSLKPQSWPASPYPGVEFDAVVNRAADKVLGHNIQAEGSGEKIWESTVNAMGDAASGNSLGTLLKGAVSPAAQAVGRAFNPEVAGETINLVPFASRLPGSVGRAAQSVTAPASAANVALSGVSGSAAGAAQEAFPDSALAPIVAGLAVPAAAPAALNLGRSAVRGSFSPAATQNALDVFGSVNTTAVRDAVPSVGQATGNRAIQSLEGLLSKMPFAGGVMARRAGGESEAIQGNLLQQADVLDYTATPTSAGRKALRGVTEDFIPTKRGVQSDLYNKLDTFIPPESPVATSNFGAVLGKLNTPIAGAGGLENAKLLSAHPDIAELGGLYNQALEAGNGNLSFGALKEIRSRIGEKLADFSLSSDKPTAQLKQLYGALSQDMGQAAKAAGDQAEAAFNRANNYTRALNSRIDILQNVVDKAGGVEKIFEAATAPGTNKFGATNLGALMKSLPDDAKKTFASAFIRNRLGRPNDSIQNAEGTAFSTQTFLTNWSRMSPEAKRALFGSLGSDFVRNMDTVAKSTSTLRQSSAFYANPSGTGPIVTSAASAIPAIGQAAIGNVKGMVMFGAPLLIGWAGARALTSPSFVRFLAKNDKVSAGNLLPQIDRLTEQARKAGDEAGVEAFGKVRESLNSGADLGAVPDNDDLGLIPDPEPTPSRAKKLLAE